MKSLRLSYDLHTLRGDVMGCIAALVVGLPIMLALGVVSGLGPLAGVYGAIALGFCAAVFGGSKTLMSGPSGAIAVLMAVVVASSADDLAQVFTIVVMAGLMQVLLGALRIGRLAAFVPYSVIAGFMSGIGMVIILLQVLPFLGAPGTAGGVLEAVRALPEALSNVNPHALALASVTLTVCVFWPERLSRFLPSSIAGLATGTLLGVLWLTGAPTIGEIPTGLPELQVPNYSLNALADAVKPALAIALLGSIQSLLVALAHDSATRTRHDPNQELVGQGIGNAVSGLISGLPGAGAADTTMVSVRVGARTRAAAVLRALLLLALVLGIGGYIQSLPLAVLAGILMKTGWDTLDLRLISRAHRVQREHLLVMLITMGLTVFLDLATAVGIGLIAAAMASARRLEQLEMDSVVSVPLLDRTFLYTDEPEADFSARVGMVALRGSFSVASSNNMIEAISADIRDHQVLILDFSDTLYMDDSAAMMVEHLIRCRGGGKHSGDSHGAARLRGRHPAVHECVQKGSRRPFRRRH